MQQNAYFINYSPSYYAAVILYLRVQNENLERILPEFFNTRPSFHGWWAISLDRTSLLDHLCHLLLGNPFYRKKRIVKNNFLGWIHDSYVDRNATVPVSKDLVYCRHFLFEMADEFPVNCVLWTIHQRKIKENSWSVVQ